MKKRFIIRILMLAAIIAAAVFVVAASHTKRPVSQGDECMQENQECVEPKAQSEFLLEAITRNLLGR